MDRKEIKNELDALIKEGDHIYIVTIFHSIRNIYKDEDKAFEELTKQPIMFPKGYIEDFLSKSSKKISEEQRKKIPKLASERLLKDAIKKVKNPKKDYQVWYDRACEVLRILRPKRLEEFEKLYTGDKTIKNDNELNFLTTGIFHYMTTKHGQDNDDDTKFFNIFASNFVAQRNILSAIRKNFDNELFNLERNIGYGFYKSTMDIAKDIQKEDPRIAGAIASVVLEVHLKKLAVKNGIEDKAKNSITDYNNFLKRKGVYDSILADQIKSCNKIRNKCVHTNKGEPTIGEVGTIIHITDRVAAEVN